MGFLRRMVWFAGWSPVISTIRGASLGFDQRRMIPNFGDPSGEKRVGGRRRDTHTADKMLTHGHALLFYRYRYEAHPVAQSHLPRRLLLLLQAKGLQSPTRMHRPSRYLVFCTCAWPLLHLIDKKKVEITRTVAFTGSNLEPTGAARYAALTRIQLILTSY